MAKTDIGIEVQIFEQVRMSNESLRMWRRKLRGKIINRTYPPQTGKLLLPYEYFTIQQLGQFVYNAVGREGIFHIRDWIKSKRTKINPKTGDHFPEYHTLAVVKLMLNEGSLKVIPLDLMISRHKEWRQRNTRIR